MQRLLLRGTIPGGKEVVAVEVLPREEGSPSHRFTPGCPRAVLLLTGGKGTLLELHPQRDEVLAASYPPVFGVGVTAAHGCCCCLLLAQAATSSIRRRSPRRRVIAWLLQWRARHRRTPSESVAPRSAGGGPVARR